MSKTISILINAMGGEGGGVLTGWIVAAARDAGLAVQATSVPGVAQRTGATTYYIEMARPDRPRRAPVFALLPVAGQVDIVLASELVEAGRAVAGGYVTPERTTIIASTHRVYSMPEKTATEDGRLDSGALAMALAARAQRALLVDLDIASRRAGVPIGAAMLGALAAAEVLPLVRAAFEDAIRADGRAVERNLAAFAAACDAILAGSDDPDDLARDTDPAVPEITTAFPAPARAAIAAGLERLSEYQGAAYSRLYLDRLEPFAVRDPALCTDVARELALRMSYEDVIRVAQLKARPDRRARIRSELGLNVDAPFHVAEYFAPGIEEICDLLPALVARPLLWLARHSRRLRRWRLNTRLRSTTVWGFARLWLLARLRHLRRLTWRYAAEQRAIERWLGLIDQAAHADLSLAREITLLSQLIKGYSDTARRGRADYEQILDELVVPLLDGAHAADDAAATVAAARRRAAAATEGAGGEVIAAPVSLASER
ncbi:MAG: indolepyruvate oxidoreductase subunit beta family protein [Rhodospirillales bacterium]|nr:MAG: indolepyruvate oxidoreductase subunit beta family protein [Rhodospirillales bacterium]